MHALPIFAFALRPFSLGVSGLMVLIGEMPNGDREAISLCTQQNGQSDATRQEFARMVDMDAVLNSAQFEAEGLIQEPGLPVSWIQTTDISTRSAELAAVFGAVSISLRSVKSATLLDVLARIVPPTPVLHDLG